MVFDSDDEYSDDNGGNGPTPLPPTTSITKLLKRFNLNDEEEGKDEDEAEAEEEDDGKDSDEELIRAQLNAESSRALLTMIHNPNTDEEDKAKIHDHKDLESTASKPPRTRPIRQQRSQSSRRVMDSQDEESESQSESESESMSDSDFEPDEGRDSDDQDDEDDEDEEEDENQSEDEDPLKDALLT